MRCLPGVPPPRDGETGASADADADAASAPTHTLEATVTDQGRGMTAAECERIFGAYEAAAASAGGGSGLGLYIARACARRAGGDVYVRSVPGQGSEFTVRFPVAVARADWAAVEAAQARAVQPSCAPPQQELQPLSPPTPCSSEKAAGARRTRTPAPEKQQLRCLLADDHRLNLLVRRCAALVAQ